MAQSATRRNQSAKPANVVRLVQPTTGDATVTTTDTDIKALIAQRRAIDEQIKTAKAAMPKPSPLERVIAKQAHQFSKWVVWRLANRIGERMRAGQPRADATRDVLAFFVAQVDALLDDPTTAESEPDATTDN